MDREQYSREKGDERERKRKRKRKSDVDNNREKVRGSIGKSKSKVERDGRRKSGGAEDTRQSFR